MMRRSIAVAVLLLGCASTPSTSSDNRVGLGTMAVLDVVPEVQTESYENSFGLVWMDAPLHRSPDDDTPLRLFELDASRDQSPGFVWAARVLQRRGDWLEVGAVRTWLDGMRSIHCVGSDIFNAPGIDVRVWVHVRDFAPVLTKPLQRAFDDGTSVHLLPGTPVVDGRPWARGYWLPIDASEHADLLYTPLDPIEVLPGTTGGVVTRLDPLLGGKPVKYQRPPHNHASGDHWLAMRGEHFIVGECGQMVLESSETPRAPAGGLGLMGGAAQSEDMGVVQAGVELMWNDGMTAGVTYDKVARSDLLPSTAQTTCTRIGTNSVARGAVATGQTAEVCFPTAAISFARGHCASKVCFDD